MRTRQTSITAAGIAIARAVESEKPVGERIGFDPYARRFVPAWMYRVLGFFIKSGYAERRGPGVNGFLIARERCVDEVMQAFLNSTIVFDYIYTSVLQGIQKHSEVSNMQRYRFMTGEGLTFGIAEDSIEAFLRERGFCQVQDVNVNRLKAAYFTGKNSGRNLAGGYGIATGRV